MTQQLHPELIWVYGIDNVQIGPVHLAYDIQVESILQGEEKLTFKMFLSDPKLVWIDVDCHLEYPDGKIWHIARIEGVRSNSETSVTIEAKPSWYELVDDIKFGPYSIVNKTVHEGLDQILVGTGWTTGYTPADVKLYSFEGENLSVLELIRAWATITSNEVEFITNNKQVILKPEVGMERGIGFRYGRNLEEVVQTYEPPHVTRLYPIGANEIGIGSVNAGVPYIDNFSWYTNQGITEAEALSLYLKEAIWQDDKFILGLNLYDAAVAKLATLSQPTISYTCRVMDLSALTGLEEDQFDIGDTVRVQDAVLDIDIRTRIVRLIKKAYEPQENEVELSYLKPGLTSDLLNTVYNSNTSGSSGFKLLVDESEALTISSSNLAVCTIQVTSAENSNGTIGAELVGVASGSGTLAVSLYIDSDQIGASVTTPFTSGQNIHVGVPTWFANLTEGPHTILLRAIVSSGSGTIAIPEYAGRLYTMMTGVIGGGGGGGNTTINEADTVASWDITATDSGYRTYYSDIVPSISDTVTQYDISVTETSVTVTFA